MLKLWFLEINVQQVFRDSDDLIDIDEAFNGYLLIPIMEFL